MNIVYITHKKQDHNFKNRSFWGIAEYDDYLLAAHRTAKEMADLVGCKITDLHYQIFKKHSQFGFVFSGHIHGTSKKRVDSFIDDLSRDIPIDVTDPNPMKWFDFEDIDVDDYIRSICFPNSFKEDVF